MTARLKNLKKKENYILNNHFLFYFQITISINNKIILYPLIESCNTAIIISY